VNAGLPPSALLATLAGALLVAGILTAVALRRRKPAMASSSGSSGPNGRARHVSGADLTVSASPIKGPPADPGQTAAGTPPATNREQAHPPREGPDLPDPDLTRSAQIDADQTRAAGPFALRAARGDTAAGGQSQTFCSHCGQQVQPGARFCASCGQPVG
jgi:hypothetical protein